MISVCVSLIVLIAGLDLAAKWYVETHFQKGERHNVWNGKIQIRKVHNKGMMLNLLDKRPVLVKTLSFCATVLIVLVQMLLFRKTGHKGEKIGLALMTGGAISNTYDRMKRGYVVDYIGFVSKKKKLENVTYNIGDFAIFAGALVIVIKSLFKK